MMTMMTRMTPKNAATMTTTIRSWKKVLPWTVPTIKQSFPRPTEKFSWSSKNLS
jgi:hypothetical protein